MLTVPLHGEDLYTNNIEKEKIMSGQLKLSKIFYINPESIHQNHKALRNRDNAWKASWVRAGRGRGCDSLPQLPPNASDEKRYDRWDTLKTNILTNGFDNKHPILIHLDSDNIIDGNHRLAIALELKLDYVPVRFQI
jgi:hypothetical protein